MDAVSARQGKHVSIATNQHTTEELLEEVCIAMLRRTTVLATETQTQLHCG